MSLLAVESHDRGSKRTEQASERTDLAAENPRCFDRCESTTKRLQPCCETNAQISLVFVHDFVPSAAAAPKEEISTL